MVVVPAIIDTAAHIQALVDDLEVRFFANRDPHLHFALLTDFRDAPSARRRKTSRCSRPRAGGASSA